ncbi:unnamed protein product [Pedinophyceae sp. YPF-701]|nr:unnamed protein product [Pedinophyceae sp. YPF-701]
MIVICLRLRSFVSLFRHARSYGPTSATLSHVSRSLASEDDSLEAPLLAHGEGRPSPRRCAYLDWCSKAHNRYFMCIQCWIAVCGPAFVLQATPWRMWPVCYDALARTVSQVSLIAATTLCFRDQPEDRGEDAGDEGGGVAAAVCR